MHKNTLPRGGYVRLGAVAPGSGLPTRQGVVLVSVCVCLLGRSRWRLHVVNFHAVLNRLQTNGHLGEYAYGFLLSPSLFGNEVSEVAIQHDSGSHAYDCQHSAGLLHNIATNVGKPWFIWFLFAHGHLRGYWLRRASKASLFARISLSPARSSAVRCDWVSETWETWANRGKSTS